MRPIYLAADGRQYVNDPDGEQVFGAWVIPRVDDAEDSPIIVIGDF